MWKPGQLVTIDGIVYRIKSTAMISRCYQCAFGNHHPHCWMSTDFGVCTNLIPPNCYLEKVRYKRLAHE